jgi:hypothetical protein
MSGSRMSNQNQTIRTSGPTRVYVIHKMLAAFARALAILFAPP